jgi:hypothetical protein
MKKIILLSVVLLMIVGIQKTYAEGDELINKLTSELNITPEQAMGGAGALFNYAKEGLSSEEFEKVSDAVPNMDGYLDAIPDLGGGKSSTGLLGKATEAVVGMPAVTKAFDKLGLSPDMVGMFTPILVNYVDDKGGEAVGKLLDKVFTK